MLRLAVKADSIDEADDRRGLAHLLERDLRSILRRVERAESLSRENIHAVVRKYFPQDRYTVVMSETEAGPIAAR